MAGANHEFVGENHTNPPNHQNQSDGVETFVTPEGSAAHAQATPLNVPPPHQPPQPEDPLVVPQVPQGAPMEVVMAALVNTINRQGQILREQANNMRGQNELIREQNRRLRAVEESRAASRISRSARRQRSSTPENHRSRSRSRSPRPAPRRNGERPLSPPRDIPRRQNHFPPQRNNHVSPPRNRRSPPRRNNRSPPRNEEAAVRGGNVRHSPRRESSGSGDERHRGPVSRRILDIPLPRGLEKPPTLDKYDGTTDPDEHVQSVETALDYRNLRGSIKCKLFPLSLVRGASTWWRNLPPGSIDSWEELCRTFTAHFTTSRRHPKTVASLKAIVQGPEEPLRNYIERFNKVSVEVEATDKMKLYLLEEGLREGTKFQEAVGILEVQTLDAFFELAQRYIKYEDKQKASEVRRPKTFEVGGPSSQRDERRGEEKRREGGKVREAKPPKSQFTYHTPLNAPRDRILSEISSAEFKSAGIRFPQRYIKYEDKQKASEVRRPKTFEVGGPSSQRDERRGEEKRREGGKVREAKPPKSQFTYHTPLNAPRDRILSEISSAEFKSAGIRFPKQLPAKPNVDKKKFCRFHKSYGHVTDDCVHLKDAIEILIQNGYARQYVDGQPRAANNNAPRQNQLAVDPASPEQHVEDENRVIGGVALAISRPEDFLPLQTDEEKGALDYLAAHLDGSWENFPGALVISGGGFNPITIGSIKRKFDELEKASPVEEIKITEVKESSVPLAFYREEVPGGSPNFQIPLLVRAKMANFDVRRILVDQGSSCDIMYSGLFKVLQLTEENLVPYVGSDLQGFNGSTTKPWGYVDLIVTFGENKAMKSVKRMMNKVFHNEIGDMLEVYMDDMIVKSEEEIDHTVHLKRVFDQARKFNMRFNPEKCTFGVKAGKFLVLTRPVEGEKLYLYLAVASEAISAVLIRETEQGQKPVYFVSRALQGPELRYLQIEKIALAVIMAVRKLRYYFLAHSIIIRTDQPVKQLLARPDMVGRMLKWSLELAEFDISFESRKALKAQVLADFVAEMTTSTTSEKNKWTIFVDGSSNSQGSGAGIILENGDGVLIEVSLGLSFPTTNNQAEYEAFLAGLRLAEDIGAEEIRIFTDSQLVASQVSGEYQTKEERLLEYLILIRAKLAKFKETEVKHVPREHNARADVLSKLASTRRKKAGNQSLIQETLTKSSIEKTAEVMHICAVDEQSWMSPVYNFLKSNTLPVDAKEAAKIQKRACSYVLLDDKLYRRGFSIPLLKCVEEARVEFILQEIHEGINGQHIGGRALARKALRAGYYWPTMQNDAKDHWGMDILGPLPTAARQVKYLIVAVDYFTKWIEAEPLAKISASNILRLFKRNVLARFRIPQVVVTDNGTQFTNKKFREFLATIGTTQHFTSVEHPQTNGQAEAANRVLLRGLRRRMDTSKGNWTEELHNILWSYRTTPHSTTGETPFRLTYGTEAVIPVEIGEPSSRIEYPPDEDINDELLREELDLVEELRTGASLREATLKQKIAARHDKGVIKREFKNTQLAMGCSMSRGRISNEEIFLDSGLGASQTLEQFDGVYDPRHQEATVNY
ncbi:hypothetical protein TSUD_366960 [Trifolium subterraneum]|uniref:Uncharacterized protein n=1 Tax=Trifolium subterraneum TaxID=3900 RepID=A0A2Z6N9X3_TRISU|nr:hypothetical protein TSUD_366960 [Trifolium subterraneum]